MRTKTCEITPAGCATAQADPFPTKACARCDMCGLWCQAVQDDPARYDAPDWFCNQRRPIRRGEYLFRAGESVRSIYALRNGSLKLFLPERGRERITAFHFAGELVGLHAVHSQEHDCSAVALEDGYVCEVPFDQLERLCRNEPASQRRLHQSLSREIVRHYERVSGMAGLNLDARLAAFLLNLSRRFSARSLSATLFPLCMSREEIGNYLGMTAAAVSRILLKFQGSRLISTHLDLVELVDVNGLRLAASGRVR